MLGEGHPVLAVATRGTFCSMLLHGVVACCIGAGATLALHAAMKWRDRACQATCCISKSRLITRISITFGIRGFAIRAIRRV